MFPMRPEEWGEAVLVSETQRAGVGMTQHRSPQRRFRTVQPSKAPPQKGTVSVGAELP